MKDWFGNGFPTPVDGKVEFIQETEFARTSVQMDITGLNGEAGKYGIHTAPVKVDLQFPCTEATLGVQHNPLNATALTTSAAFHTAGTSDQYPVGDLSNKFGQLTGFKQVHAVFNDTNLPLYGPTSVVGRSFVFNRAADNERYVAVMPSSGGFS